MLHLWLIPALMVLATVVLIFYFAVRRRASGVRADGRTVHDVPVDDDNPPPS
jgi:uncharacterized membrane protein